MKRILTKDLLDNSPEAQAIARVMDGFDLWKAEFIFVAGDLVRIKGENYEITIKRPACLELGHYRVERGFNGGM